MATYCAICSDTMPSKEGDDQMRILQQPSERQKVSPDNPEWQAYLQKLLRPECLDLAPVETNKLCGVLEDFSHVFAISETELGSTDLMTQCIDIGDQRPTC